MNPVLDRMVQHRSIRRFAEEPLPDELVARVVRAAQQAATSSHVQAYSLLRVRDPAKRTQLAEQCGNQAMVARAPGFFVVCGDARRHRLVCERAGTPFVANLETFLLAAVDASLFAQNLALGFESEELGICFVGGLRNRLADVDRLLGLPSDVFPLFGLCVGRPAEGPAQRPRLPLEAMLFEDTYPEDAELLDSLAGLDEAMAREYAARGKPGYDWSGGIARKFARAWRTDLRAYYESKGARLD